MRVLGLFLLVVTFPFACNLCIAADELSKPGDQVLYDSLNAAYQPLKSCVDQKMRTSGKSRQTIYSEIAASGGLSQVLLDEKEFLGTPSKDVLAATNSEHVRLVIETLERAEPYKKEKSYMYKAFGLRRQIAATSIIARSPSIHCDQPSELGYWIEEEDGYEALTNLWTFSKPFTECELKHTSSLSGRGQALALAVVQAGELPELMRIANKYLGRSDPSVIRANHVGMTNAMRVQTLLIALGQYVGSSPKGERYRDKAQRTMVAISLQRLTASATHSKCIPSAGSIHWIEEIDKRRSQQ